MRKEYDFSKAWRSEFWKYMPPHDQLARHTKERITIFIDLDILNFFRARAAKRGKPAYQTQINQALREYMEGSRPPTKGSHDERRLIAHLAEQVAKYAAAKGSNLGQSGPRGKPYHSSRSVSGASRRRMMAWAKRAQSAPSATR